MPSFHVEYGDEENIPDWKEYRQGSVFENADFSDGCENQYPESNWSHGLGLYFGYAAWVQRKQRTSKSFCVPIKFSIGWTKAQCRTHFRRVRKLEKRVRNLLNRCGKWNRLRTNWEQQFILGQAFSRWKDS
jgi:hypothetical protein